MKQCKRKIVKPQLRVKNEIVGNTNITFNSDEQHWNSLPTNNRILTPIIIEEHREHVNKLFFQLKLNSLEDWIDISSNNFYYSKKFRKSEHISSLIKKYYQKDMKIFLSSIYPNYPWPFNHYISFNFTTFENQQEFMAELFIKLKLKSLEDWLNISNNKIIQNGGYNLIEKHYKKDKKILLSSLYPNFPWDFSSYKKTERIFQSIEEQRKRMDEIFQKLKLKSHDDWFNIPRKKIIKNGGGKLLYYRYKGDLFLLLTTIYPNHSFTLPKHLNVFKSVEEDKEKEIVLIPSKKNFNSIENQRLFMDQLFTKLNLKTIDDWLSVTRDNLIQNGGLSLLRYYKGDFSLLLQSIYPNFLIDFKSLKFKSHYYFTSIENQREFMDYLFKKFKLKSFDDWVKISRTKIQRSGAQGLLSQYNNNMKTLFSSIYPNYPWENSISLFRYNLSPKIKELIDKYHITQKKDWYRLLGIHSSHQNMFDLLKEFYPSEKWKKSNFQIRAKKTTQRLLFSFTQKIYPSLLLIEDYYHPKLIFEEINLELDIFIPALQLALEYQGQQHYDDMPAVFGTIELLLSRDEAKEKLAKDHSIKIIYIPFWWDQSLSSLRSSLQS